MNAREVIWLIVIGILLTVGTYFGITSYNQGNRLDAQSATIKILLHPRVTTVITRDSIVIKDSTVYHPSPVLVTIYDTIRNYPDPGTVSWYDSVYKKDGARFRWRAKVLGSIDDIKFSDLVFPKEIITKTIHVDTCIEKPAQYLAKNHLGVDFNLSAKNLKDMPNVEGVFWWSLKDKFKINLGTEYSFTHGELMAKAGFGFYIR